MKRTLGTRLEALEAAAGGAAGPQIPTSQEVSQKIQEVLTRLRADQLEEELAYAALGTIGRVHHWQTCIDEALKVIHDDGHDPDDEHRREIGVVGVEVWPGLRVRHAEVSIPAYRWNLLAAQLDRLQELGYSTPEVEALRAEHGRWEGVSWQWRDAKLPADAAREIDDTNP